MTPSKPLRLWPGVAAVALGVLIALLGPIVAPGDALVSVLGPVAMGAVVFIWWLLFSRVRWIDRLGIALAVVLLVMLAGRFIDRSVSNGMMGNMLIAISIPVMGLALVVAAAATRRMAGGMKYAAMIAVLAIGSASLTLVRTGGISGGGRMDLHWRWTPTPEDRLLAQEAAHPSEPARVNTAPPSPASEPASAAAATAPAPTPDSQASPTASTAASPASVEAASKTPPAGAHANAPATSADVHPAVAKTEPEWPGFRGPARDGVVHGVRIATDWTASPPVQMWRRAVGPGWSSFAVHGDVFYTQEQRGEDELVAAYRVSTGEPVWQHRDPVRFWESNGGAGPRATPTLSNGRVYTFGGTGVLNALNERDGSVIWSRNASADTGVEVPGWGFASSPLVVNDVVVIATSGRLAGYDAATGAVRWLGPKGGGGYSSPHLVTIDGVPQIVLLRGSRTVSVAPADGTLLWEHTWQLGVSIVQPAVIGDHDILLTAGDAMGGLGARRVAVTHSATGWNVDERWTSRGLKPYFNDLVIHKGFAFGFDGNILSCIDLKDGERKWKGGRYGNGQMILLEDEDLLLVTTEDGEIALVSASPDQFREVAKVPALDGKTWNHPVLVGDVLLVRNGQEMVAFRVPLAKAQTSTQ